MYILFLSKIASLLAVSNLSSTQLNSQAHRFYKFNRHFIIRKKRESFPLSPSWFVTPEALVLATKTNTEINVPEIAKFDFNETNISLTIKSF